MRKIGLMIFVLFFIIMLIPFFIISSCEAINENSEEPNVIKENSEVYVKVLNTEDNKAMELGIDEYIKGVVAAEMPVNFELEALKAQAVAARTYTLNRLQEFGAKPDDVHPQYELCTDYRHCQAWISKDDRLMAWSKNADLSTLNNIELWSKIEEAVDTTKGESLIYNGELIDPLFHSSSGGATENSEDYFTASLPYLRSVSSEYEKNSPYISTNFDISEEDFKKTVKNKYPDIELKKSKMIENLEIMSRTESGRVDEIRVGNKTLTGREVRELLNLRSNNFTVKQDGNKLVFSTNGNGHGVGLSQYGANGMAQAGFDYVEILKHYYTGVDVNKAY